MTNTATHPLPDGARECVGGEGAVVDAVAVHVTDVDLDAGVVLGRDQLVGPGAEGEK